MKNKKPGTDSDQWSESVLVRRVGKAKIDFDVSHFHREKRRVPMLVLSRKKNESIRVGPGIDDVATIVVVEIRGDKVRLGIEAPKEWSVHRQEVYDAIKRSEEGGGTQ